MDGHCKTKESKRWGHSKKLKKSEHGAHMQKKIEMPKCELGRMNLRPKGNCDPFIHLKSVLGTLWEPHTRSVASDRTSVYSLGMGPRRLAANCTEATRCGGTPPQNFNPGSQQDMVLLVSRGGRFGKLPGVAELFFKKN